jgi:hypothetical protein
MKDIRINEIKPLFNTIITTLDVYEEDLIENGVLKAPQGSLRMYQKVLAVGDSVRGIKVGDIILINFKNFVVRKYKDNSLKEDMSSQEDEYIFDIPRLLVGGKICGKISDADVEGVITEFEEFETEQAKKTLR